MNVIDGMEDRLLREEIAVVARSFLPEPKAKLARPLLNRKLPKKRGTILDQDALDLLGVYCPQKSGPRNKVEC